jgi:DeoR family transcriptional regulator, aga operon transcriptional repressor
VITNAVNIATELAGSSIEVILTGGTLRENSFSLVGPLAEETLRRLNADILFLAVDGFDVHFGPTTPNLAEAHVNQVMVESSRRRIVVCDSSKFGRRSLCQITTTSNIHHVITDSKIAKADLETLTTTDTKVTMV